MKSEKYKIFEYCLPTEDHDGNSFQEWETAETHMSFIAVSVSNLGPVMVVVYKFADREGRVIVEVKCCDESQRFDLDHDIFYGLCEQSFLEV